mgnify:CR=1 FL=1
MKITTTKLKQVIREELRKTLKENSSVIDKAIGREFPPILGKGPKTHSGYGGGPGKTNIDDSSEDYAYYEDDPKSGIAQFVKFDELAAQFGLSADQIQNLKDTLAADTGKRGAIPGMRWASKG